MLKLVPSLSNHGLVNLFTILDLHCHQFRSVNGLTIKVLRWQFFYKDVKVLLVEASSVVLCQCSADIHFLHELNSRVFALLVS